METKHTSQVTSNDADAGGMPDLGNRRPTLVLLIALLVLALAAPLLVTLPQTLDAVASPPRAEPATHTTEQPFHERYVPQATTSWEDTLDMGELATWRLRSSD